MPRYDTITLRLPKAAITTRESVKDRLLLGRHDGHGHRVVWGHAVHRRTAHPRLLGSHS